MLYSKMICDSGVNLVKKDQLPLPLECIDFHDSGRLNEVHKISFFLYMLCFSGFS